MSRTTPRFFYHILCVMALLALTCTSSYGEIFAYIDSSGELMISNQKNDSRFRRFDPSGAVKDQSKPPEKTALATSASTLKISASSNALRYTPLIEAIATEVGVSAHLLHAVIQVESAYDAQAISPKGAHGLMQVIPATAARFGIDELHDPASNIRAGARYLKKLIALFDNDLQLVLAAYNAGEGAVKKYNNKIPPYPETQAYVVRVQALFEQRRR